MLTALIVIGAIALQAAVLIAATRICAAAKLGDRQLGIEP